MRSAIVLLPDNSLLQRCSHKLAQRMLHHGFAKIVKFYPFTLQLKNYFPPQGSGDGALLPAGSPDRTPSQGQKLKLPMEMSL